MIWQDLGSFDDPQVRFDSGKFERYERLIAIRNALPALQTGFYHSLVADDATGAFAFARTFENHDVYVVLNRADHPATISVPSITETAVVDWLNPANVQIITTTQRPTATLRAADVLIVHNGQVDVQLPAYGSAILAPATP